MEQDTKKQGIPSGSDSRRNHGVPDFFVDTIMSKLPTEARDNFSENDRLKMSNYDFNIKKNNSDIAKISSSKDIQCSRYNFSPITHKQYDVYKQQQQNLQMSKTTYSKPETTNQDLLQNSEFKQNLFLLRQQMFQSSFYNSLSALSSILYRGFATTPSVNSVFSSRLYTQDSHFESRSSDKSFASGNNRFPGLYYQKTNKPSFLSYQSSETSLNFRQDESKNILMKLNSLSENIIERNEEKQQRKKRIKSLDKRYRKVTPQNIKSFKLTLNQNHHQTSSIEKQDFENETMKNDAEHPAWVFCTRYSDRPCAGPRIRRSKKDGFDKKLSSTSKRERTAFSELQLANLQKEFKDCPYLTEERRVRLSRDLGLSVSQIKVWFQNKRAKVKKASGVQSQLKVGLIKSGIYEHGTVVMECKD